MHHIKPWNSDDSMALQWRHNENDGVSNHQPHHCLRNRSFRHRSQKTSKLCVTGICEGNLPVTGEFPTQMASSAENVSIWWRHHGVRVWWMSISYKIMGVITYPSRNLSWMTVKWPPAGNTVYPKKYAHGFVVLCFVVVMQSFIMNSHKVFIHIHQGCFAGTGAIVRLPQCQWSKPDGYGKISQCITTTKHSKAKTVCIFLGIYCIFDATLHEEVF